MSGENHPTATELRVARDRKSLTVTWADGSRSTLGADLLRRGGQSADALRARIDGREAPCPPDISIETVEPVGAYAVNIAFSDGYRRGIYPWAYLARLADQLQQDYPAEATAA